MPNALLHEVSRSVFWNTALLPLVTAAGLLLSIVVRRAFGLESGMYDVVLGIANSILFYSSLGLAGSLPRFLPELQMRAGRRAASRLIWRLASLRLAVLLAIVVALNVWAGPISTRFDLGADGTTYLRWLSVLLIGRALLDFLYRTLDSFLQQLSVNVLSLVNGILDVALVAIAVGIGLRIAGVVAALGVSAAVTAIVAAGVVVRQLAGIPTESQDLIHEAAGSRVWKLSALTYLRDLSLYFATPAFASPVLLGTLGSPEPVALFAIGYFVAASTVTLVVSGFRGIYRPAFARVLVSGERAQLHRAFDLMNKLQVLAVVPAGAGLTVMVADYLPLLYGQPFTAAVPVARVMVVLLFAETALAVGLLVLWADERYRPVLIANAAMVAAAPLFVWTASRFGLVPAAFVLGGGRLAASVFGYTEARRMYGVRYPWEFAAKVAAVSALMAVVLFTAQHVWSTSIVEAATLTVSGVVIVALGLRAIRVMGPDELELLSRASIPGRHHLVRWLQNPSRSNSR